MSVLGEELDVKTPPTVFSLSLTHRVRVGKVEGRGLQQDLDSAQPRQLPPQWYTVMDSSQEKNGVGKSSIKIWI